ncbi:hypothetical protein IMZ48_10055 [Candidatus Bathyarchaeota archaeon]|nr:hypothetical protein [Candidatus Bathyarchaeota archaeon]
MVSDPSTDPTLLIPRIMSMVPSAVRARCLSSGRPYSKFVYERPWPNAKRGSILQRS